jgi:hypothetical protein
MKKILLRNMDLLLVFSLANLLAAVELRKLAPYTRYAPTASPSRPMSVTSTSPIGTRRRR